MSHRAMRFKRNKRGLFSAIANVMNHGYSLPFDQRDYAYVRQPGVQ